MSAKCKSCAKAYDDARLNDPKRVAARLAYSTTLKGRARHDAAKAAWSEKNPKKRKAQWAVGNAVRGGKLTKKPCEQCGGTRRTHAHHDDYEKVYDVRWLCSKHHREWHRANGEALNPF